MIHHTLAAGWARSNSLRIQFPSFVTTIPIKRKTIYDVKNGKYRQVERNQKQDAKNNGVIVAENTYKKIEEHGTTLSLSHTRQRLLLFGSLVLFKNQANQNISIQVCKDTKAQCVMIL